MRCLVFGALLMLSINCRQESEQPVSTPVESPQPDHSAQGIATGQPPAEMDQETAGTTEAVLCKDIETWTLESALERFHATGPRQDQEAICAAIRLVQLGAAEAFLADPDELADLLPILGIGVLSDTEFVLGIVETQQPTHYWSPWQITQSGEVRRLSDPNAGPAVLRCSPDPEVFPHLLVTPRRVIDPSGDQRTMIMLLDRQEVRFAIRYRDQWPYVALVLSDDPTIEVARYLWKPFEEAFHGPAHDDLPAPATGTFRIDLNMSDGLEPVGGKIPPPIEPAEPPADGAEPLPV